MVEVTRPYWISLPCNGFPASCARIGSTFQDNGLPDLPAYPLDHPAIPEDLRREAEEIVSQRVDLEGCNERQWKYAASLL